MSSARDLLWASGHDETVEVNQRALIDKVLARYSGEFTVFRELLQNSDDAQSKAVEIRFETQQYLDRKTGKEEIVGGGTKALPDLKSAQVNQWTFKNNGIAFRDEDWSRLKKIAEGNPDEEKIGAFGVGFYSLFSVTEEPFVTSGGQWMGFHWKDQKDQLLARRGNLDIEDATSDPWTSFEMTLREPAPIPVPFDFTRFLASSLTFMAYLSEVSVYFDDKRLSKLTKVSGIPKELGIPKGFRCASPRRTMTVRSIHSTPLHIKAEVMRWVYSSGTEKPQSRPAVKQVKASSQGGFFSSLFSTLAGNTSVPPSPIPSPAPIVEVDPMEINETNVVLSIFSADVDVQLDKKMAVELHRSTKKNPPKRLKYELIYTAKDEYDASKKEDELQPFATGSVFQGLRADLEGTGSARVFIGHATAQTTGLGGHMAARFIPTVERESIDLVDRHVAVWNQELLYVGGFLARSAYEMELVNIRTAWEGATSSGTGSLLPGIDPKIRSWLQGRALHALRFFEFHQSTPSAEVSRLLEAGFFSSATDSLFPVISTAGVRIASEVRLPDDTFSTFLKMLPVLSEDVINGAQTMVNSLRTRGMVKAITFEDVLNELRSRPLPETEMIACLKWWVTVNRPDLLPIRTQLLEAAVLTIGAPGHADEQIIPLSSIRTFINSKGVGAQIILEGPLPSSLLPNKISNSFPPEVLSSSFPWTEFTILEWVRYISDPAVGGTNPVYDISLSAVWAERILTSLQRAWPSISNQMKGEIVAVLRNKVCVPTSAGLRTPEETYFANANVFSDLPIVTLPSGMQVKGNLEKFLQALGVRKHVDLQVVFNRMIKTGDWTIADLTKYLVAVQSTLTAEEWARLKMTAAFSKEANSSDVPPPTGRPATRFQAKDLYEPLDIFRQLKLPIIDWGTQTKWRGTSEEAKFLFELGLRRSPPLQTIIDLCASPDTAVRPVALKYLVDNIGTRYKDYDPSDFADIAFLPAIRGTTHCMGTPKEVFSKPVWASLGYLVVEPNMQHETVTKLKIKHNPPTSSLVSLLEKTHPKDEAEARQWFGILAGRISDFSIEELRRLAQIPMVPVTTTPEKGGKPTSTHLPPSRCFFGGDAKANFHSKLFVFVDFGTPANGFLSACGTKQEPTVDEIAQILLADPHRFYDLAGGRQTFLNELRNIAVNSRLISSGTLSKMKKSPILLGSRRKPQGDAEKGGKFVEIDDEEWELQYDLRRPDQIVIADDTNAHQFFADSLFSAPQEDILEGFYADLGSRRLSSLIKEEYKTSAEVKDSKVSADTRALLLERLPLFLHEHTHTRTKVSYSWMTTETNFVVKTFGKLLVTKSLTYGDVRLARSHDASAVAKRFGYGPIQLWLAGNAPVDMYEVATSLCRLIFETPKANDSLLLYTILSTDLTSLKRRGYNVDRILRQQKADRQAALAAKAEAEKNTTLLSKPLPAVHSESAPVLSPRPSMASSTSTQLAENELASGMDTDGDRPRPTSLVKSSFQNIRQKLGNLQPNRPQSIPGSFPDGGNRLPPPNNQRPNNPNVTPQSNISSNIDMAIKACRPEDRNLLQNREMMQQVKESLNEGYCDLSGRTGDLNLVGEMGTVKVFVAKDVPHPQTIMTVKHDALARFIHIMNPLATIYELPLASLHVFYDLQGDVIAFNRNASIFLNLRYFEAWHDDHVRIGRLNEAYISWYFTLAHEIAHNLVQPHNSEHEFYFSAICERHIMKLGPVLSSS